MKDFFKRNIKLLTILGIVFLPTLSFAFGEEIGHGLLWIGSLFVWIGGGLFNLAVEYNLDIAKNLTQLNIVSVGWEIFRDIANMGFIFILVYISINTILGNNEYHIKKTLGMIIVAAVAVNFSMFATKAVIDIANIPTVEIYNAIIKSSPTTEIDRGLSERIAGMFKLGSVYRPNGVTDTNKDGLPTQGQDKSGWNLLIIGLMGMVFLMIAGFIFLSAAFMFIARYVNFVILILLSPLAFASLALGKTSKHFNTWLDTLLAQAFFAPVFLLLMLIIINGMETATVKGTFVEVLAKKDMNAMGIVLNFFILGGLLIGALTVAKMISSSGSQTIMNYANKGANYFNNKGIGAAKWAGSGVVRNTIGQGAQRGAEALRNRGWGGTGLSKLTLRTLEGVGDAKFGRKEGYKTERERLAREEIKYADKLNNNVVGSDGKTAKERYIDSGYATGPISWLVGEGSSKQRAVAIKSEKDNIETQRNNIRALKKDISTLEGTIGDEKTRNNLDETHPTIINLRNQITQKYSDIDVAERSIKKSEKIIEG